MTWPPARTMGATSATAGHCFPISSASWGVRVSTLPAPKLTPPLLAAPDWTMRLLAPMLAIVFCSASFEPWPISATAITAPTAMITPSAEGRSHLVPPQGAQGRAEGGRNQRGQRHGHRFRLLVAVQGIVAVCRHGDRHRPGFRQDGGVRFQGIDRQRFRCRLRENAILSVRNRRVAVIVD